MMLLEKSVLTFSNMTVHRTQTSKMEKNSILKANVKSYQKYLQLKIQSHVFVYFFNIKKTTVLRPNKYLVTEKVPNKVNVRL